MEQTAMQDLREDLVETISSFAELLGVIDNEVIRLAYQDVVKRTLNAIIKRIDDELLETEKQQQGYSEEDLLESFIDGYKFRAEASDLIFDNASRMYAIHIFNQKFKNK
jgi:hypothetical protein